MSKEFNLEEVYGSFLDILERHISESPDEPLTHFGVKGMKWGVRKDRSSSTSAPLKSLGPDKVVRKTASGEEISLTKEPPSRFQRFMGRHSQKYRENYANSAYLTIRDGSGKKIGEAQVAKKNAEELNLVWLGINRSSRGKGYATSVMKAGAEFGRQEGFKRLTLEVPKNAPDARHIYEKLGFKVVKEPTAKEMEEDIVFGGLTEMVYDVDNAKHAQEGTGIFMGTEKAPSPEELLHYGVKGMKWGVRKDRPEGVSRSTNKAALKDAREFARAKMFYGEGAGTRRKLIKASVEAKSKRDPSYKKAFDHHLAKQDMAVHASKARRERKRKNVTNSAAKTTRGVSHYLRGNPQYASAAAAMLAGGALWAHKNGVDKAILKAGKTALKSLKKSNIKPGMTASDFLKNF